MVVDYDIVEIEKFLKADDYVGLKQYMETHDLVVVGNKIKPRQLSYYEQQREFYDQRQLIKKILLNSLYGCIGNPGSRWYDSRVAQSTTLCGRCIVKHMSAKINEIIAGEYNHVGDSIIYGDTDSEIGSTVHITNFGEKTVEELFNSCQTFWNNGDKEYAHHPDLMVMSYDSEKDEPYLGHINYIYRHKTSKDLYEIEDENGNIVTVTEDHSVMVERSGTLIEVKPQDIVETDILISLTMVNLDK